MDLGLHDHVVVVTGGARGIGAGVAAVLAAEGSVPVVVGRDSGIFKKHGFDVEVIHIRGGALITATIMSGSVQFSGAGAESDRIAKIGSAYMGFVVRRPEVVSLMFGPQLPNREAYPALGEVADAVGQEIGVGLHDQALGLAVWASVHGLAMLILRNVIDLGQRKSALNVLPSRAEIILRSLFSTKRD